MDGEVVPHELDSVPSRAVLRASRSSLPVPPTAHQMNNMLDMLAGLIAPCVQRNDQQASGT
jgi:hypothetical protein